MMTFCKLNKSLRIGGQQIAHEISQFNDDAEDRSQMSTNTTGTGTE